MDQPNAATLFTMIWLNYFYALFRADAICWRRRADELVRRRCKIFSGAPILVLQLFV
jgi:hypothetical protein